MAISPSDRRANVDSYGDRLLADVGREIFAAMRDDVIKERHFAPDTPEKDIKIAVLEKLIADANRMASMVGSKTDVKIPKIDLNGNLDAQIGSVAAIEMKLSEAVINEGNDQEGFAAKAWNFVRSHFGRHEVAVITADGASALVDPNKLGWHPVNDAELGKLAAGLSPLVNQKLNQQIAAHKPHEGKGHMS